MLSDTRIPERLPAAGGDIAASAMKPMLEMVLGSRLTFSERLDPVVLAQAARILLDLEPVLGCWLDEGPLSASWARCPGPEASALFSMVESTDPDRDATAFHSAPFSTKGPRIAVLLLRSPDRDDLCVRFDHVAGDGWSAKEVTYLLAETYTRLVDDPGYSPAPRVDPRPTHGDVWDVLTDQQRAVAANVPKLGFSNWSMKLAHGTGDALALRSLTLPLERTGAVREHAHARGATVNEALIAAFLRSVASMFPPADGGRPGVSVSADPRRFAPSARLARISNIATTQTVLVDYRHGETFDETLRHVADGVAPWRDCLWSIGNSFGREASDPRPPKPVVLRAMFGFLTTMMRLGNSAALVTMNVGPFDDARLAFGTAHAVRALVLGPIPRFSGFAATISSYRGAVTLSMGARNRRTAPDLIERALSGIDQQLRDAVQDGALRV